jgi:hypothetical protein
MSCFLKYFIAEKREGKTEVTGGQGRRSMQLLDDLTEKRSYGTWMRKHYIPFCTENALEEAMDLL